MDSQVTINLSISELSTLVSAVYDKMSLYSERVSNLDDNTSIDYCSMILSEYDNLCSVFYYLYNLR